MTTEQRKIFISQRPDQTQGSCTRMAAWKLLGILIGISILALSVGLSALAWSHGSAGTDAAAAPPIVTTPNGRFQGVVTSAPDGKDYVRYTSIPYAKPPVGDLRFKRPQPLDSGSSIRNSDSYKKSCWSCTKTSTDPYYGEDCLYLNVFVPGDGGTSNTAERLPVMVWIHGGGFVAGSPFPEPVKMVTRGNVIVVTVSYRLGVFGFLTTEDDEIPSNNGLWDQYMAIKWVKENIHWFSGNDSSITVFGESAGAMSASIHTLSPVSSALFHKAIFQSGAAPSSISRYARQRAHEFGERVGCSAGALGHQFIECLQNVSVSDILEHGHPINYGTAGAQRQLDFIWMPVIDGEFIPDEPITLLQNRTYLNQIGAYDKDYIIGVLNDEGALVPLNFLNPLPLSELSNVTFFKELTDYLLYNRYGVTLNQDQDLQEAIYKFYTGSPCLNSPPIPQQVLDLAADAEFVIPSIESALSLSRYDNNPASLCFNSSTTANPTADGIATSPNVYFYHFDHCLNSDLCNNPCMPHGSEVALEFPNSAITDPVQKQLSDIFIDLLTTFVKTSEPGTVVKSGWPRFEPATQSYLVINTQPSVRHYPFTYRVNFWLNTVNEKARLALQGSV